MDNSIKDINHSLSIQAETLGEPAETEASWYAMRVFMNKVGFAETCSTCSTTRLRILTR